MHGSYTHRITCNLYPAQYYILEQAAARARERLAPFIRDAALAYVQQKIVLPQGLQDELREVQQRIRRVGGDLTEIAERAGVLQRLTHGDLQRSARLVQSLDRQLSILAQALHSLSHVHQIYGSQES